MLRARSFKLSDLDVRPLPSDDRKRPWLWRSIAKIELIHKPTQQSPRDTPHAIEWNSLFFLGPDQPHETVWIQTIDLYDGKLTRKHFNQTEWTPLFRSAVAKRFHNALAVAGTTLQKVTFSECEARCKPIQEDLAIDFIELTEIMKSLE